MTFAKAATVIYKTFGMCLIAVGVYDASQFMAADIDRDGVVEFVTFD